MREYTSLLELVRSEPIISENIKATYRDMWHPEYAGNGVRYVYKTTIIEGLNIYMSALCKENDVIYICDWTTTPLERYEELIKKHVISHIKVAGNLTWFNNVPFAAALNNTCGTNTHSRTCLMNLFLTQFLEILRYYTRLIYHLKH